MPINSNICKFVADLIKYLHTNWNLLIILSIQHFITNDFTDFTDLTESTGNAQISGYMLTFIQMGIDHETRRQ